MKKNLWERALFSVAALTGAAALLAACGKSDQEVPRPQVGTGAAPPVATVEPAPTQPTPAPQASMASTADADANLTTQVKTALLSDPEMQALTINVDTREGIVQLSGFVDSREQTEKAAAIAAAVEGVRSVDNKLDLRTGGAAPGRAAGPVTDATITTQIKESLLADPYLNNIDVIVTTRNGEVQLSGFVPSQEQADDVLAAAHRAEGVKKVVSTLSVGGSKVGQSGSAESR